MTPRRSPASRRTKTMTFPWRCARAAVSLALAGALALGIAACSGGGAPGDAGWEVPACGPGDPALTALEYRVAPVGATASASAPGSAATAVYDHDDAASYWSAGAASPQWIVLDLGSPRDVTQLRLCAMQREGAVAARHRVYGSNGPDDARLLAELVVQSTHGQLLTATVPPGASAPVRYLRIETTTSEASVVAWGKIDVWARATHVPSWFGYYADAFSWLTPATAEVAGHVNLSWVGSGSDDLAMLLAGLQQARDSGLKVGLALPPDLFFTAGLDLVPQYLDAWNAVAAQLVSYRDAIAFIYPIDEPYSQAKVAGVPAAAMKSRLEAVGAAIKASFPEIPAAFSFSAIDFDTRDSAFADLVDPIPAHYDWFGFDCYGSWDQCGEPTYRAVHPIPWYVEQIKARLRGGQRIFLFPDAFVRQAEPADAAADAAQAALRVSRADKYLQLALSDAAVVGLFPFLYQDDYFEESRRFLGVRHWPALQQRYREIGAVVSGK